MSSLVGGCVVPQCKARTRSKKKINKSTAPVCRLFGPSVFEASKLKVVFVGDDHHHDKNKELLIPRTYTLTHCDLTSNLTLSISQTINTCQLQGWYNRLQRDEVIAEWRKMEGKKMCLRVHCHVSGGHFLLDLFASFRYNIFCKELPMVLKAFLHGDCKLFENYPELQEAMVWVYFHSNNPKFDQVECWGPLSLASTGAHCKLDGVTWENLIHPPPQNSYYI